MGDGRHRGTSVSYTHLGPLKKRWRSYREDAIQKARKDKESKGLAHRGGCFYTLRVALDTGICQGLFPTVGYFLHE